MNPSQRWERYKWVLVEPWEYLGRIEACRRLGPTGWFIDCEDAILCRLEACPTRTSTDLGKRRGAHYRDRRCRTYLSTVGASVNQMSIVRWHYIPTDRVLKGPLKALRMALHLRSLSSLPERKISPWVFGLLSTYGTFFLSNNKPHSQQDMHFSSSSDTTAQQNVNWWGRKYATTSTKGPRNAERMKK